MRFCFKKGEEEGNQIKEVDLGTFERNIVSLYSLSFQMIQKMIECFLSNQEIKLVAVGVSFTCCKVP